MVQQALMWCDKFRSSSPRAPVVSVQFGARRSLNNKSRSHRCKPWTRDIPRSQSFLRHSKHHFSSNAWKTKWCWAGFETGTMEASTKCWRSSCGW